MLIEPTVLLSLLGKPTIRLREERGWRRPSRRSEQMELRSNFSWGIYPKCLIRPINDLKEYGCEKIFTDKVSGVKSERVGLKACMESLSENDTLVVWRLDRLGRSLKDLVSMIVDLKDRGIKFKSIKDGTIDTTTASGELIFNIFASLAQFERDLIRERTNAGLKAARARGKLGGRPKLDKKDPRISAAKKLHADTTIPIPDILKTLNISRSTLYRFLKIPLDT